MPKLTRKDWEELRNTYEVAFTRVKPGLFKLFLDKIYGNPGGNPANQSELVDDTDAMMIYLASGEPPIQPARQ